MPRAALLLACLALSAGSLGGCATQRPVARIVEAPPGAPSTNPAVVAACREEMARQLARQDRGQILREDERDVRLGSDTTGPLGFRAPIDRMGREFRYERMVEECVRLNTRQSQAQQAQPLPEPPPAPPRRAGR
ncbi:hypothetical protein [Rubritepida flocculans]|uniref:hypothetical protein n=1 Tax=Rubritepida flocculans TaxID=182403 RepID=UPI00041D0514|nr:hypothetical protein [Rubritepida flocculans]